MTELSEHQLEKLAVTAAKKAVEELFERFGIDVTDVRGSQADFVFLRKRRLVHEGIGKWSLRTLITLAVTGVFTSFWLAVTTYFKL